MTMRRWLILAALCVAAPAAAQEERDYCPERPGLDTPACTIAPGKVSVETALADWTLDRQVDSRTDTILFGDTLVRVGVGERVEARFGWTPYGHVRERDRSSGDVDAKGGAGDVYLGVKASLLNPDGDKLSIAVLPYATLPVGRSPVGAGDWGAGVLLPVTYELSDRWSLDVTPEVDAAVNQSGDGRHLAYSGTAGLAYKIAADWTVTGEGQVLRDDDPDGHATQTLAALSVAWLAGKDLQFDVFGAAGLDRAAPDVELYAGVSRRF